MREYISPHHQHLDGRSRPDTQIDRSLAQQSLFCEERLRQVGRSVRRKSPPLACQTACSAAWSAARTARLAKQKRRRGTVGSAMRSLRCPLAWVSWRNGESLPADRAAPTASVFRISCSFCMRAVVGGNHETVNSLSVLRSMEPSLTVD